MVEENLADLTVFTTTYNRAHTLHRVYDSLCQQPEVDFEWLVVDAESKDGTEALVRGWAAQAPFSIRLVSMPNRGKHGAINLAATITQSPYLIILDSDDSCVPGALALVLDAWTHLPSGREAEFGVVTFLCRTESGAVVGSRFPADPFDSTYHEMVIVHGMRGDKWECYRTSVLREFPFPEVLGEAGLPENILLGRIGTRYKTRYVNQALRVYHNDGPDSSVVRTVDPRRNSGGRVLAQRDNLTVPRFLFWSNPRAFFLFGVKHARMCSLARVGLKSALGALKWRLSRVIALVTWPLGRLVAAVEATARVNASGVGKRS
jgi:glycosyltransferase involved in cell wall biosynthesis